MIQIAIMKVGLNNHWAQEIVLAVVVVFGWAEQKYVIHNHHVTIIYLGLLRNNFFNCTIEQLIDHFQFH